MTRMQLLLATAVACGSMMPCASAAALAGTFNMSGEITVTATTITWNSDISPNLADMFTLSSGAMSFATENGQNGIADLNISLQPVGSTFPHDTFITFTVVAGLPTLDLNFIYSGTGGSAGCSEVTPVVNHTCTPPNVGGSPFTFTDDPGNTSDAKFVFAGVSSDGTSAWSAIFTSQFNTPYQDVLAAFAPGGAGSVSNSYSATVTVSAIPEPASFFLGGLGFAGLLAYRKFRRA